MKLKLSTNTIVNLIGAGIIIFTGAYILISKSGINRHDSYNSWASNLKPVDEELSENLPYNKYMRLKDSILTIRHLKNGDSFDLGSRTVGYIGLSTAIQCDTCSLQWYKSRAFLSDNTHRQNYIELLGWTLDRNEVLGHIDDGKFYVERNQGYVRRVVVDTTVKRKDGSIYRKIHLADIPVKFRYNTIHKHIMIPISEKTADVLNIVSYAFIIIITFGFALVIVAFVKLLINLSKGQSFTCLNVFRLRLIAICLLAYPVFMFLLNYAMRFIFHDYFTPDIILKADIWETSYKILAVGAIFLLLYRAFSQGEKLKEEQDLTI